MENKEVALGNTNEEEQSTIETALPINLTEKVNVLTSRIDELTKAFNTMHISILKEQHKPINIPAGTLLFGKCSKKETILVVTETGFFIGNTRYNSLSAAAKNVSGVRRSGWAFWKTIDGRTAKEAFNNT